MSQTVRHPGEVLRDDFMAPLGLTANALAMALRIPSSRITDLIKDDDPKSVTPEMALLLANYFGTMTDFWINLQTTYDFAHARGQPAGGSRAIRNAESLSRLHEL